MNLNKTQLFYNQYCTRYHISWVGKKPKENCKSCKKKDKVVGVNRNKT